MWETEIEENCECKVIAWKKCDMPYILEEDKEEE